MVASLYMGQYIGNAGFARRNYPSTQQRTADLSATKSIVDRILNLQGDQVEYDAAADAQRISAAGYTAEEAAYESGAKLSETNALYARIAGQIQEMQAERDLLRSVGDQRAAIAGSGFQQSGSAVAQVRASLQEGYLEQQLIRTQTLFDEGAYLEQAAASRSLSGASATASQTALDTADTYDAAAEKARVDETNLTASLSEYLKAYGSPEQAALTDAIVQGTDATGALADLKPQQQQGLGFRQQGGRSGGFSGLLTRGR